MRRISFPAKKEINGEYVPEGISKPKSDASYVCPTTTIEFELAS